MNRQNIRLLVLAAAMVLGASIAHAQRSTELYIPIGKSPGQSGKYTVIGTVQSLDLQNKTIAISDSGRTFTIHFSKVTKVYVDCSLLGKPNVEGAISDCKNGMMVEVKYLGNKMGAAAEWIKVRGR